MDNNYHFSEETVPVVYRVMYKWVVSSGTISTAKSIPFLWKKFTISKPKFSEIRPSSQVGGLPFRRLASPGSLVNPIVQARYLPLTCFSIAALMSSTEVAGETKKQSGKIMDEARAPFYEVVSKAKNRSEIIVTIRTIRGLPELPGLMPKEPSPPGVWIFAENILASSFDSINFPVL